MDASLTSLDLSHISASIRDMDTAFGECESLQWLDLSGISTQSCDYLCNTFGQCNNLQYLRVGEDFVIPAECYYYDDMLLGTASATSDKTLNIVCSDVLWNQLNSDIYKHKIGLVDDEGNTVLTLNRISDAQFLDARANVTTASKVTKANTHKLVKSPLKKTR